MTHEFRKIVKAWQQASAQGIKAVLAAVVALDGSSYRRPGVRMLILDNGKMTGAVSGGCVEKEIARQAETVFREAIPKIMTYDGRYRLGCEGILYILIEPLNPSAEFLESFNRAMVQREEFHISSFYEQAYSTSDELGSLVTFGKRSLPLRPGFKKPARLNVFEERMAPCFKLVILGSEHDAVQLCSYAALAGWEVAVCVTPSEEKEIADFPGATQLFQTDPEAIDVSGFDPQTAIILMTHSYVKDLKYLLALKDCEPAYLGLLGPAARREKLLGEFMERCPEVTEHFFDRIHGPAGLNIGAETPQEIAIAVLAEILSVIRSKKPIQLKNKKGAIHS
jgi:xanthine/CO dehydrogenase XdhC/CoxF family maturation factor